MKKLLVLLFLPLLFTCSSDSNDENNEPVLGVDNLSEYFEGKYFYYSFNLTGGGDAIEIFSFQENGVRDVVFVCGAFGGICNSSPNGGGESCHNICSTINSNLIIDLPNYMELSNGNQFELIDGELFYSSSGAYNYLLNDFSLEEQNQQIEENPVNCGGNC